MSIYRYRQFRAALKIAPFKGKFMPYRWGKLPPTLPITWMAYAQMFDDFSQELANVINSLTRYTHQLAAWRDVEKNLDNKGKLNIAVEFVDPLATVALNLPYAIRSRFIFASSHLSHQANRAKYSENWKDDLNFDEEIYFAQADATGSPWKKWKKLKQQLERINDKKYQSKSSHFRNAYNHRFSPRIVIGYTNVISRVQDTETNKVSYRIGGMESLGLSTVVDLLEEQCQACYAAFEAFQMLVREQESAIVANIAQAEFNSKLL